MALCLSGQYGEPSEQIVKMAASSKLISHLHSEVRLTADTSFTREGDVIKQVKPFIGDSDKCFTQRSNSLSTYPFCDLSERIDKKV